MIPQALDSPALDSPNDQQSYPSPEITFERIDPTEAQIAAAVNADDAVREADQTGSSLQSEVDAV